MGFIEKIQSKLELYRLEKRYIRNRNRRSTFVSNAMYVDGEYVYQTPNTTGSSTTSSAASTPTEEVRRSSLQVPTASEYSNQSKTPQQTKRLHRLSSMPGFGSKSSRRDW